jgi:S1-C subfamily serine protease
MARTSDGGVDAASEGGPSRRANVGAARTSSRSDAETFDGDGLEAATGTDTDAGTPTDEASDGWGAAAPRVPASPRAAPAPKTPQPQAARLRTRILPRSVLGIASLILAFAIGAGFSGVVLYSYYQYKLNQTNERVNTLVSGYKKQFTNAEGDLAAAVAAAKLSIQNQLKVVQQLQAGPAALAALVKQVAPAVYFVHTLDVNGQPSVGSAFVVSSNSTESLLLTSYTTVQAATRAPAPAVFIRQGNTDTQVTVRTWDPQYDLALLVVPQGNLHALAAAPLTPAPQPGDRIYAVSGLGSAGASIAQGSVIDVSASGIAEDAAIGPAFQGGPLINQAGQVLAVGSRTYAPLGFSSDGVWFAPYVEAACNIVLVCPGGTLAGSH